MYISTAPAVMAGSTVLTYQLVSATSGAPGAASGAWSPVLVGLALVALLYAAIVRAARRARR